LRPNGNCPVFFYGDDGKFKQELAGREKALKVLLLKEMEENNGIIKVFKLFGR